MSCTDRDRHFLGRIISAEHPCRQHAYQRLIELAVVGDANLRENALERLPQLDLSGLPLLEGSLDDQEVAVRSAALDVVIRVRRDLPYTYRESGDYTVRILEKASKDPDPKIRERASKCLPQQSMGTGGMF